MAWQRWSGSSSLNILCRPLVLGDPMLLGLFAYLPNSSSLLVRLEWSDAESFLLERLDVPWEIHIQGEAAVMAFSSSFFDSWVMRWLEEPVYQESRFVLA